MKKQTPTCFLYASAKDGGLGIPCMQFTVPRMRHQRVCRLTSYSDDLSQLTYDLGDLDAPVVAGHPARSKEDVDSILQDKLLQSMDGKGFRHHRECPSAHRWVCEPTRIVGQGFCTR